MNRYEFEATCICPNGVLRDRYSCTIQAERTIQVEGIVKAVAKLARKRMYQEDIADALRNEFMARVEVVGWHFGIRVTCVRE